jgi:hypothetical protein
MKTDEPQKYCAETEAALGHAIRALMRIERSTDTKEQGRIAMAALAYLRAVLGENE